jgi:hypothetical protein
MPYRLRYTCYVDWVGPGQGFMTAAPTPLQGDVGGNPNGAQSQKFLSSAPVIAAGATTFTQPTGGAAVSGALAAGDITTMLASMSADLSTQINAQLGRLQSWVVGNP